MDGTTRPLRWGVAAVVALLLIVFAQQAGPARATFADADGDGAVDLAETSFGSNPANPASTPEIKAFVVAGESCFDGIDNDLDGFVDDIDPGCDDGDGDFVSDSVEVLFGSDPLDPASVPEDARFDALQLSVGYALDACFDGFDDDQDGLTDGEDGGCAPLDADGDGFDDPTEKLFGSSPSNAASVPEHNAANPGSCSDGIDNDLDLLTDAADPACTVPANDDFASATVIPSLPYSDGPLVTKNATFEGAELFPSCIGFEEGGGGGGIRSVWYRFSPAADTALIADTAGSDFANVLSVWRDGPSGLTEVTCSASIGSSLQAKAAFEAEAGQTYYFQAGALPFGPDLGELRNLVFNLDTLVVPSCPPAAFSLGDPPGDIFSGTLPEDPMHDIVSVSGGSGAETLCLTVGFGGPVDPPDAPSDRAVISIIEFDTDRSGATGAGSEKDFNCESATGLGVETRLSFFEAGGMAVPLNQFSASGGQVPSDEFAVLTVGETSFTLAIPLSAIGGDDAFDFAFVAGSVFSPTDCAPNGGFFRCAGNACIAVPPPPGPPNDNFANAEPVAAMPFTDMESTRFATREPGEPQPCVNIGRTIWYSFTPSEDLLVTADTFGSGYDTALAAYRGSSLAGLTNLACNDDTSSLQSRVSFEASAGETYYLQAGGFFGDAGDLVLHLTATSAFLSGDVNCDDRVTSIDALLVSQLVADLVSSLLCDEGADVNGNGRVDAIDTALILQFVAGLIPNPSPPIATFNLDIEETIGFNTGEPTGVGGRFGIDLFPDGTMQGRVRATGIGAPIEGMGIFAGVLFDAYPCEFGFVLAEVGGGLETLLTSGVENVQPIVVTRVVDPAQPLFRNPASVRAAGIVEVTNLNPLTAVPVGCALVDLGAVGGSPAKPAGPPGWRAVALD